MYRIFRGSDIAISMEPSKLVFENTLKCMHAILSCMSVWVTQDDLCCVGWHHIKAVIVVGEQHKGGLIVVNVVGKLGYIC